MRRQAVAFQKCVNAVVDPNPFFGLKVPVLAARDSDELGINSYLLESVLQP